jgi:hypothetical protein
LARLQPTQGRFGAVDELREGSSLLFQEVQRPESEGRELGIDLGQPAWHGGLMRLQLSEEFFQSWLGIKVFTQERSSALGEADCLGFAFGSQQFEVACLQGVLGSITRNTSPGAE